MFPDNRSHPLSARSSLRRWRPRSRAILIRPTQPCRSVHSRGPRSPCGPLRSHIGPSCPHLGPRSPSSPCCPHIGPNCPHFGPRCPRCQNHCTHILCLILFLPGSTSKNRGSRRGQIFGSQTGGPSHLRCCSSGQDFCSCLCLPCICLPWGSSGPSCGHWSSPVSPLENN